MPSILKLVFTIACLHLFVVSCQNEVPKPPLGAVDRVGNASVNSVSNLSPKVISLSAVPGAMASGSTLYLPEGNGPYPLVIMMHGSDGGADMSIYHEDSLQLLNQGVAVLTYCYFQCPGLPDKLIRIPLDKVVSLANWYKQTEFGQNQKVGLMGVSRGAEKSMIISSLLRSTDIFAAIGAHAPNDYTVSSFDPQTEQAVMENGKAAPAWTWQGQPVLEGQRIAVEQYSGPIYLSHGTKDEVWSYEYSVAIDQTRKQYGLPTELHLWQNDYHTFEVQEHLAQYLQSLTNFFVKYLR